MVRTLRGRIAVDGCEFETGAGCAAASGVARIESFQSPYRRERLWLSAATVTVDADDDFGNVKLVDLPTSNLLIVGAIVNLSAVGTGGVSTITNVDVALGTVLTASTTFSNAGEDDIVPKIDTAAGGVVDGASSSATTNVFLASGAKALYLNVGVAIGTDGTVAFTGYIDLVYLDLGVAT